MAGELVPRDQINQVRAFHIFSLFGGDVQRTAMLVGCAPTTIESLAHDFGWRQQLTGLVRLDTEEGKTVQREVHRVGVFVVAERAKRIVENILTALDEDEAFAESMLTTKLFDREGNLKEITFNAKALADLIKGLQIASDISYRALGDDQKASPADAKDGASAAAVGIATYKALQDRFNRMNGVDTVGEVSRVTKTVVEA